MIGACHLGAIIPRSSGVFKQQYNDLFHVIVDVSMMCSNVSMIGVWCYSDLYDVAVVHSGLCDVAVVHSGLCDVAVVHSGLCDAAVVHSGLCDVAVVHSGLCDVAVVHSGLCDVAVVHCEDGATHSGLFVSLALLCERLNEEQEVDVYHVIKHIKRRRTQIMLDYVRISFAKLTYVPFIKPQICVDISFSLSLPLENFSLPLSPCLRPLPPPPPVTLSLSLCLCGCLCPSVCLSVSVLLSPSFPGGCMLIHVQLSDVCTVYFWHCENTSFVCGSVYASYVISIHVHMCIWMTPCNFVFLARTNWSM